MPKNLKRQFSFVYWLGFKDGVTMVTILFIISFILLKIIFKI